MVKAKAAGSFIGGLFNNPTFLIIGALGITLFIFKDKISEFFAGLKFPDIEFPAFPEINFPEFPAFPEITLPEFPDFTNIFSGIQEQLDNLFANQASLLAGQTVLTEQGQQVMIPPDTVVNPDGTVTSSTPPFVVNGGATQSEQDFAQQRAAAFDTLFALDVLPLQQLQQAISAIPLGDFSALNALVISIQSLASELTPAQEFALGKGLSPEQEAQIITPPSNIFGLGGGPSFMGGTTTLGSNIVDTLLEVLQAFPNLSASQAANLLESNQGLTQTEFSFINPFNPSISSAGGDPEQIINNASGGFSGLTPQQIALLLTGGNIQNF